MLDEDDVTSGATNEEMELDITIQTPDKNLPKQASNASLVSQNNGKAHLGPDKAAHGKQALSSKIQEHEHLGPYEDTHEEQASYELGAVNAEIQEILTDIKVKKLAKKEAAAEREAAAKKQ